ncbi:MAG: alpha-L-fucosidase [Verrucomicrobia bacterium]|nr:alpha-L-fucosidase [Verrucomicrobiota bacterium]
MKTKIMSVISALLAAGWAQAADLSKVPQMNETKEQRDERMQWFRDAKFGMFIHWGPCSIGKVKIGWGRKANRPWDINGIQTPRTDDPVYDNYFKSFEPSLLVPVAHLDAGAKVPGGRARFIRMETNNDSPRELLLKRVTVFGVK